ncbi:MAG TPA: Gfo/Idh/MocA family oxidoreductase, partial [Gemmatimonadales bacterium]|nr:Gfo/Idh/MocA family oxidoreductase [Gemmatimonadales bacterium]
MSTSRRDFVKAAAGVSLASAFPLTSPLSPSPEQGTTLYHAPPMDRVRIGFVGVGGQGSSHVENLLTLDGVDLVALCDIVPEKVSTWQQKIVAMGRPEPKAFTKGPRDFERLCAESDVDLVFNATPWEWHVPICLAAMRNGKHAASEVPIAYTVDDCWALVEAAEK